MEDQAQQIANAAALVVRPETDPSTRRAASAFLETWTQSVEAWELYGPWLASFATNHHVEHAGVELLCLQLLQAKIRRELPRGTHSHGAFEAVRAALSQTILKCQQQQGQGAVAILQSACICLTSLEIRLGNLGGFCPHVISSCSSHHSDPSTALGPLTALRLLGEVPTEVERCSDLNATQITEELLPYWDRVAVILSHSLATPETCSLAAHALRTWVRSCHVTLTQLGAVASAPGQHHGVLHLLVQLLSQTQDAPDQATLLTAVSRALNSVIRQQADSCTPGRQAAVVALVEAARVDGFIGGPLLKATSAGWDDATHALVTLLCTLVTEEIDEIVQLPADGLLNLMLEIQRTHPNLRIKSLVLEAWLTVQDVPTAERHENWRAPLTARVTDTLLEALSYPSEFVNWEEEINMEQSELDEYRRLAPDVLVGCYNMLRVEFVQRLSQPIVNPATTSSSWTTLEVALYALAATSREVCGRIKTHVGGTRIMQDKQSTSVLILNIAEVMLGAPPPANGFLTTSICRFWGAYAAAWPAIGSSESVLKILDYLRAVMEHPHQQQHSVQLAAARAIKPLLTVSAAAVVQNANVAVSLLSAVRRLFTLSLASNNEDVMLAIGEGCVRLLVGVSDVAVRDNALGALVHVLMQRGQETLAIVPTDGSALSEQSAAAVEATVTCMNVLCVIVRFAESDVSGAPHLLSSALSQYTWPFLEAAGPRMPHYISIFDAALSVQEQLLRSAPEILAQQFSSTLQNCVAVFETNKNPSTLSYISSAVEAFGAREAKSFEELLNHVSKVLFAYILGEKTVHECTELVEVYFDLCLRYLLFCPTAIVRCEVLPGIASCAVECLVALKGERNSTRATLNFLEKLVSWRRLPVSTEARQALEMGSQRFDEIISTHGQRLIQSCFDILVGGPRPLWPPSGDCLFAVVIATISWPVPEAADSCVAKQWLEGVALTIPKEAHHAYHQVIVQLLTLAQKGSPMRSKAKMLLSDFSQAINGQKTLESHA